MKMDSNLMIYLILIYNILQLKSTIMCQNITEQKKSWFVGRTPPSSFEYSKLNGFYSPKEAKNLCEQDIQCGGFTFKGTKRIKYIIPEVYFFHYIDEKSDYLTENIKYPHWTTYIVGSRDYIVIKGELKSEKPADGKIDCK